MKTRQGIYSATHFTYDSANRLVCRGSSGPGSCNQAEIRYDVHGQRLVQIDEGLAHDLGEHGHREVISSGAVIDSGRIQVRQENVPADFALRTVLGYRARIAGCTERK